MYKKSDNYIFIVIIGIVLFFFGIIFYYLFNIKSNTEKLKDDFMANTEILVQKSKEEYSLQGYIENKNVEKGTEYSTTDLMIMDTMIIPMTSNHSSPDKYYIKINEQKFELSEKDWNLVAEGDNVKIIYSGLYIIKSIIRIP